MSHLDKVLEFKRECQVNKNCDEYNSFIQSEYRNYDTDMNQAISQAYLTGAVLIFLILLLLSDAFLPSIKRIISKIATWIILISPFLILLLLAVFAGFYVSFGACYKQACSPVEQYSIIPFVFIAILIAIPLFRVLR